MNKIRDLFNKLKRSKNRLKDPSVETSSNEYDVEREDKTTDLDRESIPVLKEKKSRPEFLTFPFWKSHFDITLARLKHSRLKKMKVPKDEKELAETKEKISFSLAGFKDALQKFLDSIQKNKSSDNKGKPKSITDHLNGILDHSSRTQIQRIFVILFLVLSSYTSGKIIALFMENSIDAPKIANTPVEIDYTRELTLVQINQMRTAKIFKTETKNTEEIKKPIIANNQKCETATKASRLPIKLINTVVLQDSVKSIASVQVRSENQPQEFREGDKIDGLAQIDKIERLNVILKNLKDGSCEYVASNLFDNKRQNPIAVLSPKASQKFTTQRKKIEGIENEGNSYKVSKDFMKDKMKDISTILTQARGIQITNPDGTISFKVVEVDPGGIFAYLGIQDDDIITQINGQPISDLNQVMNFFGKITSMDELSLTLKRNGEEEIQDYKFQ